ncbi:Uncharacterised protein [Klebsiella pneumoniae]|nr:Uncharacterised protein [Klebsiella pneumoniae]
MAGKTTRSSISSRHVLVISAQSFICKHCVATGSKVFDAPLALRIFLTGELKKNPRSCVDLSRFES